MSWAILLGLSSVVLALFVGYLLGRQFGKTERAKTLTALVTLLQSTEELNRDVEGHNSKLQDVGRSVGDLDASGELEVVQRALLNEIAGLLESNHRLEDDLVCVQYQMEQQAQELDRTRVEARTDKLSGTANRMAFDETLSYWLSAKRRRRGQFCLVLADIDHFKWINDTHGHPAGDRVVTHVGSFLKDCLRSKNYLARYGGDEFAMLVRGSLRDTVELADHIRIAVTERNFNVGLHGERVSVTFSMGITEVIDGDTPESLIARADQALYKSKAGGRNQVNWFVEEQELQEV